MDPTKSDQLRAALRVQAQQIHHREEQLTGVCQEVAESACANLSAQLLSRPFRPRFLLQQMSKSHLQHLQVSSAYVWQVQSISQVIVAHFYHIVSFTSSFKLQLFNQTMRKYLISSPPSAAPSCCF